MADPRRPRGPVPEGFVDDLWDRIDHLLADVERDDWTASDQRRYSEETSRAVELLRTGIERLQAAAVHEGSLCEALWDGGTITTRWAERTLEERDPYRRRVRAALELARRPVERPVLPRTQLRVVDDGTEETDG